MSLLFFRNTDGEKRGKEKKRHRKHISLLNIETAAVNTEDHLLHCRIFGCVWVSSPPSIRAIRFDTIRSSPFHLPKMVSFSDKFLYRFSFSPFLLSFFFASHLSLWIFSLFGSFFRFDQGVYYCCKISTEYFREPNIYSRSSLRHVAARPREKSRR